MEIIDKLTSINTNYLAYVLIALVYTVEQITFSLKEFDHPKKQTFWYLLKSPFIKINNDQ
jgi:hypothetical protein